LTVYYYRRYTQTALIQGPDSYAYTDYLVAAKFRERLQVTKEAA